MLFIDGEETVKRVAVKIYIINVLVNRIKILLTYFFVINKYKKSFENSYNSVFPNHHYYICT